MNRLSVLARRTLRYRAREQITAEPVRTEPGPIEFVAEERPVVAVCHPEWRGIRGATHAQGLPVIESSDLQRSSEEILSLLRETQTRLLIVNGYPPGTADFAGKAREYGLLVRVLLHSSMAQHGSEPAEAAVASRLCELVKAGTVDALGFTKEGQAEAFAALGCRAVYVPSRTVLLDQVAPVALGAGLHFGVFAEAGWRKNVVTQLGAVAILGGTAHVTYRPDVGYLDGGPNLVQYGLVDRATFLQTLASTDLNLAVSLYECFPVLVQESYWLGTPCLMSRTSALFRNDEVLWRFSTVSEHDNPRVIAEAAERLLATSVTEGLIARARSWMKQWNEDTLDRWASFTDSTTTG